MSEIAAHALIRHKHVLTMIGLMVDHETGALGIVSELMANGDLAALLRAPHECAWSYDGFFDVGIRALVLQQAAKGLAFLHGNGLIHRDIKPANILLTVNANVKIGDLGFTAVAGGREGLTPAYAAPEVLMGVSESSIASDVYSFALTVYETLTLASLPRGSDRIGQEDAAPWEIKPALPRPAGLWGRVVVSCLAAAVADDRPGVDAFYDPLLAVGRTRAADSGSFFGYAVLGRWDEAMAVDPISDDGPLKSDSTSAVHVACELDARIGVIRECLARGCDVNMHDSFPKTPLMRARSVDAVSVLLDAGADVNSRCGRGNTALRTAALSGEDGVVRALLTAGAIVNARSDAGITALFGAAQAGHLACVEALIAAGADLDLADNNGRTPLYAASDYGRLESVQMLLEAGAQPAVVANDGTTALMIARSKGHGEVASVLEGAGGACTDGSVAGGGGASTSQHVRQPERVVLSRLTKENP